MTKPVPEPIPASTVIIGRDSPAGIEMFMVLRHEKSDFASGALVFPGGKIDDADTHPDLRSYCAGLDQTDDTTLGAMVGAIRETFEESGILFARDRNEKELVAGERLSSLLPYRRLLNRGDCTLLEFLKKEKLTLACDQLTLFAHWITPEMVPKRFDTRFFLAAAPEGQIGVHDGRESVDSVWISTSEAISDCRQGKYFIMFPTRMNIQKLGRNRTMADAVLAAGATPVITVKPWVEERASGPALCIPENADYNKTAESLESVMGMRPPEA
jgi:8-oxo-dGTP pyrophosphatase MutT (NUDIX family)